MKLFIVFVALVSICNLFIDRGSGKAIDIQTEAPDSGESTRKLYPWGSGLQISSHQLGLWTTVWLTDSVFAVVFSVGEAHFFHGNGQYLFGLDLRHFGILKVNQDIVRGADDRILIIGYSLDSSLGAFLIDIPEMDYKTARLLAIPCQCIDINLNRKNLNTIIVREDIGTVSIAKRLVLEVFLANFQNQTASKVMLATGFIEVGFEENIPKGAVYLFERQAFLGLSNAILHFSWEGDYLVLKRKTYISQERITFLESLAVTEREDQTFRVGFIVRFINVGRTYHVIVDISSPGNAPTMKFKSVDLGGTLKPSSKYQRMRPVAMSLDGRYGVFTSSEMAAYEFGEGTARFLFDERDLVLTPEQLDEVFLNENQQNIVVAFSPAQDPVALVSCEISNRSNWKYINIMAYGIKRSPSLYTIDQESSRSCFPAEATVELLGGQIKHMEDLQLGDRLYVDFNPPEIGTVIFWGHRDHSTILYNFLKLAYRCCDGRESHCKGELLVSPGHYVYTTAFALSAARDLRVGDILKIVSPEVEFSRRVFLECPVTFIGVTKARGLYVPHTQSPKLVVDGVLTSAYTIHCHPGISHSILFILRLLNSISGHFGMGFAERLPIWAALSADSFHKTIRKVLPQYASLNHYISN